VTVSDVSIRSLILARRGAILRGGGFVLALAVLISLAVVWHGFDVKQAPLVNSSVWAINKDASSGPARYGRINTALAELDTSEDATAPDSLVQTDSAVVLMTENLKYGEVNLADPQDFAADEDDLSTAPRGTESVVSTGPYVVYVSGSGTLSSAILADDGLSAPLAIDPFADEQADDEEREAYAASAVGIGTDGVLHAYSPARGAVLDFDLRTGRAEGETQITGVNDDAELTMTAVGDAWALFDGANRLWTADVAAGAELDLGGATTVAVATPAETGESLYIATDTGLFEVALDSEPAATSVAPEASYGVPARPHQFDGVTYAAWIPAGVAAAGSLWSSATGEVQALDTGGAATSATPDPVFRFNDSTMILNESSVGWVWRIPDGALVPSSQNWDAGETQPNQTGNDAEVTEIKDPLPPTATDDEFGVRAGALVTLPVLLNDSDPNEDVLTIDASSLKGLDGDFGRLSVTTDLEQIAVRVADDGPRTGSFRYSITDGMSGHTATATVSLTVESDETERAPVWCNDDPVCLGGVTEWPQLQVTPGGSGRADVLGGWVDPEGDPVFVESAVKQNAEDDGSVAVTENGEVFFQHPDAAATAAAPITIDVTVSDSRGETTTKPLTVVITAQPELTASPFSLVTHAGADVVVDPTRHITGVAGVYSLANPISSDDAATVDVSPSGDTFEFTSETPGTYTIRYDVSDAVTTGVASSMRVTVLDDDDVRLSTAPITVFVRPRLDTTVDVFAAVSNPGDQLLVLTDARKVEEGKNSLFADVVDHRLLRVKGATANGGPGLLGTVEYTVSDGSEDAARRVSGVATVLLVDDSDAEQPIAVNDSVRVRAGAQVNVPVLENDVSADGNALVLDPDPDNLSSTAEGGLAFVSKASVRLLAPAQEGEYTVSYTVYSAGSPTVADTGDIVVTVIADGENQPPQPSTLEARVVAGQSVAIPFDSYGVDPDGDSVILTRVAGQPKHGTANISSRGDQVRYTALDETFAGTDEFAYEVRDANGAKATGTVRVGILAAGESSAPVTFTDYVQVEQGQRIDVRPLDNDVDPLGGALSLQTFEPDAAADSPDYAGQKSLISSVEGGVVGLEAGEVPGTKVFVYSVATADGLNSGTGYVVMKVVPTAVPDAPQIVDSYVAIDERDAFARDGIDVVSGKVTWLSGDISGLKLSLWHPPAGFTAAGNRITGALPDRTTLIAFSLAGENYQGESVTSYGFLLVPGENDIILALAATAAPIDVDENSSATFDISQLVPVPAGGTLEVDADGVRAALRSMADCSVESGFTLRYTAGQGEPYADSCVVPVRLVGQDFFTPLLVPVRIEAETPVPLLKDAARESIPDPKLDPQTLDLMTMVSWAGSKSDDPGVEFDVTGPDADAFDFSYSASSRSVTFAAKGSAVPGTRGTIVVRFAGTYGGGQQQGVINLTVGATPNQLPRGGSTSTECSIPDGPSSCRVNAVGLPGEFNYFSDAGELTVVQVLPSTCPGISFSVAGGSAIQAKWSGDVEGTKCTTAFVVEDNAGTKHRSTGDGNGSVTWNFEGLPRSPASVRQISYDDRSIVLAVDPGDARRAYPELQSFEVREDGGKKAVTTCTAAGSCAPIRTSENLAHHTYTAYAVNKTGPSTNGASVEAWSYALPKLGDVTLTPIYDPSITSASSGAARLTISGSEKSVTAYDLGGSGNLARAASGPSTTVLKFKIGDQQLKITPVTSSDPPDAQGPRASDASNTYSVSVAGLPRITGNGTVTSEPTALTLTGLDVDMNRSSKPKETLYIAYTTGSPVCQVGPDGGALTASGYGGGAQSPSNHITGLAPNVEFSVVMCASNGYGSAMSKPVKNATFQQPAAPVGWQFRVDSDERQVGDGVWEYRLNGEPFSTSERAPDGFTTEFENARDNSAFGQDPGIRVRYCQVFARDRCSDWGAVTAEAGANRPYQARVSVDRSTYRCEGGQAFSPATVSVQGNTATVTRSISYNRSTSTPETVPDAATRADVTYTVTWGGESAGLESFDFTDRNIQCTPKPTPTPTATDTPTSTPTPTN
jgi:hypothetical protein